MVEKSPGAVLALKIDIESTDAIYNFTGKVSKAIIISECPWLEHFFKPIKGFYKPLRVSPPLRGGEAQVPKYVMKREGERIMWELEPVAFSGEYTIEVGSAPDIINKIREAFEKLVGTPTRIKFENVIIKYIVREVRAFEPKIEVADKVRVRTTSPALLPSPLVPNQHVRRFTTSPGALLIVPALISANVYTPSERDSVNALVSLESCLSEHYSTMQKTVFVNYDGRREPALVADAKYIVLKESCRDLISSVLRAARVYGIGASRASGFGSVEVYVKAQPRESL